jgi:hypothetical protein
MVAGLSLLAAQLYAERAGLAEVPEGPIWAVLGARSCFNLVFECATDMGKNWVFARAFGVTPAGVVPVRSMLDSLQHVSCSGFAAGTVVMGMVLATPGAVL